MSELLGRDQGGSIDFTLPKPTSCYDVVLAANTVKTIVTPKNFNRAFLSYAVGTNVWVTFDGTAPVVPGSDGESTQELNPAGRQISMNGDTLKFISDTASWVNVRFDLGA